MKPDSHDFIKQIKDAKVTDEYKAALVAVLACEKVFSVNKDIANYLMALIHLEWRGFSQIIEYERNRILRKVKEFLDKCDLDGRGILFQLTDKDVDDIIKIIEGDKR